MLILKISLVFLIAEFLLWNKETWQWIPPVVTFTAISCNLNCLICWIKLWKSRALVYFQGLRNKHQATSAAIALCLTRCCSVVMQVFSVIWFSFILRNFNVGKLFHFYYRFFIHLCVECVHMRSVRCCPSSELVSLHSWHYEVVWGT